MNRFWERKNSCFGIPIFNSERETAEKTFSTVQLLEFFLFLAGLTAGAFLGFYGFLVWLVAIMTAFYFVQITYRILLTVNSIATGVIKITQDDIGLLQEADLPTVSILAPLYKENGTTVKGLVESLERLDWPRKKLEILLLIRKEDEGTLLVVSHATLPDNARVIELPPHYPETKPSALNIGLEQVMGNYVIIYDAESRPEPDQLKKMWVALKKSPSNVVAIQAGTSIRNPYHNVLTSWFSAEYASYYRLFAPALGNLKKPVPLSGHSVMLNTAIVKSLGGWDPFNVAEDCELGVRLARNGRELRMVNSTTWEEAPISITKQWFKQRRRWNKGFMQTWLVNMRQPLKFLREVGLANFLSFQLTVGASPLILLINPFFWVTTTLYIATGSELIRFLYPEPVFYLGLVTMIVGNFTFILSLQASTLQEGFYRNVKWTLLSPLYWILMSIAAWWGFYELLTKPHAWGDPTAHGLIPEEQNLIGPKPIKKELPITN